MKSILFIILLVGWVVWGFRWMSAKTGAPYRDDAPTPTPLGQGAQQDTKEKRKDARSAFTLTGASLSRIPPFPETHGLNPRKEFDNAVILGRWGELFFGENLSNGSFPTTPPQPLPAARPCW